jgi:hypothetical protein
LTIETYLRKFEVANIHNTHFSQYHDTATDYP